jgi:dihydrodipicolinate synthase/N-acetylneuraminate lyase
MVFLAVSAHFLRTQQYNVFICAESIDIPIFLYNILLKRGNLAMVERLSRISNVVGIKEF